MQAFRIRIIAAVTFAVIVAAILSCGSHSTTPRTPVVAPPPPLQLGQPPLNQDLLIDQPCSGAHLKHPKDLLAAVTFLFSEPRTAFLHKKATYRYKSRLGAKSSRIAFDHEPIDTAVASHESFEVTGRLDEGEGAEDGFALLIRTENHPVRHFAFRRDLNLYGLHLASTESIGIFETVDAGPREILKIQMNPGGNAKVGLVWRYFIDEQNALDERAEFQVQQENLVIPLNPNAMERNTKN